MLVAGCGRAGETHRAGEIAGVVHLDDGQARMLLMVGTEAAVIGAAMIRARLKLQRPVAGLQPVALRFPVGEVVGDQGLLDAVVRAALLQIDRSILGDDLGRDQSEATLTQAAGLAQEQVGRALARGGGRGRSANRDSHKSPVPRIGCGKD